MALEARDEASYRVREEALRAADVEAFTLEVEQLEGGTALSDEVDPFA